MSPFVSVVHCGWICCGSHSERGTSVPASSRGRQMEWCYRSVTNIVTLYFFQIHQRCRVEQGCIPEGCVRPTHWPYGWGGRAWQGGMCVASGVRGRGHACHACPPANRMTDACKTLPCRKLRLRVVTSMHLAWLTHTHSYKISLWVFHLHTNGNPQIHLWVLYLFAGINV